MSPEMHQVIREESCLYNNRIYFICRDIFVTFGFWLANFHSFGRRQQRSKYVLYLLRTGTPK